MIYLLTTFTYLASRPGAARAVYSTRYECSCGMSGVGPDCARVTRPGAFAPLPFAAAHITREEIVAIAEERVVPMAGASVAEARAWMTLW